MGRVKVMERVGDVKCGMLLERRYCRAPSEFDEGSAFFDSGGERGEELGLGLGPDLIHPE